SKEYKEQIKYFEKKKDFYEELLCLDGVFEIDYDGNLILINDSGAKKLGYNQPEELYNNADEVYLFKFIKEKLLDSLKKNNIIKGEKVRLLNKNGEEIYLDLYISRVDEKNSYKGIFIDITKQREFDDSLQKVEKKLKSLLENLPDIIFSIDPSGKIISINEAVKELLNIKPEDVIDKHFSQLISGKYTKDIEKTLNRLKFREEEVVRNFELSLYTKDKVKKEFDLSAKGIYNSDGSLLEVIGILRDITRRKLIEREIERTKNFLKLIQENIEEGIMVVNRDFEILLLNKYIAELIGYKGKRDELIGKKCYECLHKRGEMCIGCVSYKTFLTGETHKMSYKLKKDDGEIYSLEITSYPIKNIYGNVTQVIETIKNVTEKKMLENQISEYTLRLEKKIAELHMLNAISNILQTTYNLDAVLQIILIGVTASQGLMFNRAFLLLINEEDNILEGKLAIGPSTEEEAYKIWGELSQKYHSLEEILLTYDNLLQKKDIKVNEIIKGIKIPLSDTNNILIQAIINKRSYNVKNNTVDEYDGYEISSFLGTDSFVITPLIAKDKVLGVIIADNFINKEPITDEDLKLLEIFSNHAGFAIENTLLVKELGNKVRELEEFNRKLSEYQKKLVEAERLATIGEFANYIAHEIRNPLVSIGGFAKSMLKNKNIKDPEKEYLKIIQSEVRRLERLLTNILDFTKAFEPHPQDENLNDVLEDSLFMLYGEIKDNIIVKKELDYNIPKVKMDSYQIKQVFLNILRNALNAMPDGGEITIKTEQLNNFVQLVISDTGTGIPKELLKDVFKPFFTTKPTGIGLGLAISNQIIQNHKGNIKIESKVNEGTSVYIQLPYT
ncbi:hypothetical protein DRQ09_10650, partial [candidate division KSB1 bacterium]